MMLKIAVTSLLLVMTLAQGCNDDECQIVDTCRVVLNDPDNISECPAEDLLHPKTCHPSCDVGESDKVDLGPDTCEFVDCFTLNCVGSRGESVLVEQLEDFPLEFIVVISVDGGEPVDSQCVVIVGSTCR